MSDLQTKITPELESRARSEDGEALLDVIVELEPPAPERVSAAELKVAFRQAADPVAEAIAGLGGEVEGEAWINSTLRARVPVASLGDLSDLEAVAALDVPHQLTPD